MPVKALVPETSVSTNSTIRGCAVTDAELKIPERAGRCQGHSGSGDVLGGRILERLSSLGGQGLGLGLDNLRRARRAVGEHHREHDNHDDENDERDEGGYFPL